ncbi:MHYT domain-containing protein [Sagittula salina]|uniref:MHYT domain-containing protein n=1 Tax=Sagittula salina TaxID=2820268 RepID=A0A940S187_9RHOB|nr:MHYT domain-containing protein [Sagittula salina]MBP0483873.1 hypothetical protein [Sagittula salina]
MFGNILHGVLETEAGFVLAAAAVCSLTAATLILLMRYSHLATPSQRMYGAFWIAVIAGVGVWTTHFVAMIGYRPDAALTYDLTLTIVSIFIGIIFVGVPFASTEFLYTRFQRACLGVLSGLGVAAMHMTGMTAVQNCLATYNPFILFTGIMVSVLSLGWALTRSRANALGLMKTAGGIVVGVCALHFLAMSSVSLEVLDTVTMGLGDATFAIFVFVVALGVFAAAFIGTLNHRRSLASLCSNYATSFVMEQGDLRELRLSLRTEN